MQSLNLNHLPGNPEVQLAVSPASPGSNSEKSHQHHVPVGFAPNTGVKIVVGAILAAVGLAAAFLFVQHRRARQEIDLEAVSSAEVNAPIPVDVASVKYGPATQTLLLPGETRAWYETMIYAHTSGYVANWSADIGDHVTKGQVLATIDTPELDQQLLGAMAKLKVSEAEVAVMESNAAFAKSTYDRWWDSPKGVVSDQEREQKKAELDSSIARVNAAKSQANLDQADVNRLTELTKFKQVSAPFDGMITARRIDIGDLVTAGSTSNTISLYSISQADQIRVFVDVPQSASVGLDSGMPAIAIAKEFPHRTFPGKVARTSRAIDPVSRTLRVEVDIPNSDLALLPGMYVQVSFELKQMNSLIEVPASALLFRSGGPEVAVVGTDGKVSFRDVTIVRDQGNVVEVSSGLSADDKVALNISSQIAQGDRVTANDTDKVASLSPQQSSGNASLVVKSH